MKKILFIALAAVGLTACVQDQSVSVPQSDTIAFGNAYLDNAVRAAVDPSTTTNSISGFKVWGFMDSNVGTVFTAEEVKKVNGSWGYANTQYWAPEHDYYFSALSPIDGDWSVSNADATVDGLSNVSFTNNEGAIDLLYAAATAETPNFSELTTTGMAPVTMPFQHILSKVKFTFKNGFTTDNADVVVSNIQMTAPKSGTINLVGAFDSYKTGWVLGSEATTLAFGDVARLDMGQDEECATERFTIPAADYTYNVTFHVTVYTGQEIALEVDKTATISGYALEMGKAYNFTAEINPDNLGLAPIEFSATVEDWQQGGDVPSAPGTAVSSQAELKAALAAGGHYALAANLDIDADETLTVPAGKTVVLDLYGYSLTGESDATGSNRNMFDVKGTLTINGSEVTRGASNEITYVHTGDNMGWNASTNVFNITAGGVLNLNDVVVKNLGGSDMAFVAHLNNWGKATLNIENSTLESTYIAVRAFNSGYDMNTVVAHDSTLKGKYCFWVHNYKAAGDSVGDDSTLNIDICNGTNTFEYTGKAPLMYGFNNPLYFDANGKELAFDAAALAAALTAEKENIVIVLGADIEAPISSLGQTASGDAKQMGGVDTKTITIDLAGHKLNLTTTYWSVLGAKNSDALVTIKNGTMTSSQTSGTWDSYDLGFVNCNYAFEDVVFEKAIALGAANKNYTLKNVTINETHDYYAMWVEAVGQNITIDGLTINSAGRGIKIDEQYISAPAKVTLNIANSTVKSAKKAAIVVKSVEGAEINVSNLNIAEVAADSAFAVWVDEAAAAHASKVVVNGALCKVEGSGATLVEVDGTTTTLAEAVANAASGSYVSLAAGNYSLPAISGKDITISGSADAVVTIDKPALHGANLTLSGVTVQGSGYSTGVQHVNSVTYNNVTVIGEMCLYGESVVFNNCTFELPSGKYIWTYGCKNSAFNNCVFNTAGKAILVYNEGGTNCNVVVEGCTFNATEGAKAGAINNQNCAAIEIDNYTGRAHNVTASANVWGDNFSGEWRIKNCVSGTSITVNGVAYSTIAIDGKTMTIDANKNVTVNE